jgi:hypothetical protein
VRDLGVVLNARKMLDAAGEVLAAIRRRVALDRAPALPARCRAALRRLCGLARGPAGERPAAGDPPRPLCHHDVVAHFGDGSVAEGDTPPQFRVVGRLIDEPMLQPIYDLESPRLAFGRVAIIGDAAFVARPHVAAGVSKAADDAAALAAALDADQVEAALLRLVAERLPVGARSSNARDTSAPICWRRRAPRIAAAPRATPFPRRCSPRPRRWISSTPVLAKSEASKRARSGGAAAHVVTARRQGQDRERSSCPDRGYTLPCGDSCRAANNRPPLEPHFQPSGLNDFHGVAHLQR